MSTVESQIASLQDRYDRQAKTIMGDIDRSVDYRARELQRVYDETRQKAQNALDDERDRLEVELRAARREVFQPVLEGARDAATLWDSYRACIAEAKKPTSASEVREALQEAEKIGDDLMAKALQHRAVELGDTKSLELYLAPRPQERQKYEELIRASEEWNEFERQHLVFGLSRFRKPEEYGDQLQA
jgi:hypothetical protein